MKRRAGKRNSDPKSNHPSFRRRSGQRCDTRFQRLAGSLLRRIRWAAGKAGALLAAAFAGKRSAQPAGTIPPGPSRPVRSSATHPAHSNGESSGRSGAAFPGTLPARKAPGRFAVFCRPARPRTAVRCFAEAFWDRLKSLGPVRTARAPVRAAAVCLAVLLCVLLPAAIAAGVAASRSGAATGGSPSPFTAGPSPENTPEPTAAPTPTPTPTPVPTPTPEPHPSNTVIRKGITAPVVAEIQQRLMELGYMEEDEPTQYFGEITASAVLLFQRQHKLNEDGKVGMETYALLMSGEAQKYTVMLGAVGVDVTELQTRLRELGYIDSVTGYFGETTEQAVMAFQRYNGLTQDGKVGRKTRELLYSADAKAYFMKYGERSDEVKAYQQRLKNLGYLTTDPDGVYGNDTVAAVKRFQELNGLIADGFLGPQTVSVLTSGSARANALVLGMNGDDITNIQKLLKNLGYLSHVTGYFGSETESAVEAFQKNNSLTVDGTVGRQTMTALTSPGAKKATGGSSGSGSSSSSSAANSKVENFIAIAQSKLGCTYVLGAKGPGTFDCSGFVYYCLNRAGVSQGYLTSSAWSQCAKYRKITRIGDLQRGDILVFEGHVAIYLGNGKMIDASSSKGSVVTRSGIWDTSYWPAHFICGFRIF